MCTVLSTLDSRQQWFNAPCTHRTRTRTYTRANRTESQYTTRVAHTSSRSLKVSRECPWHGSSHDSECSVGLEPAATNVAGSAVATVRAAPPCSSSSWTVVCVQHRCRSTEPNVPATGGEPVAWRRSGGALACIAAAPQLRSCGRDEEPSCQSRRAREACGLKQLSCCRRGAAEQARAATRVRVPPGSSNEQASLSTAARCSSRRFLKYEKTTTFEYSELFSLVSE